MSKEYEPLKVEYSVKGNKDGIKIWLKKAEEIINISQTPQIQLTIKIAEIMPSKTWKP
jgi:hypothetical protein